MTRAKPQSQHRRWSRGRHAPPHKANQGSSGGSQRRQRRYWNYVGFSWQPQSLPNFPQRLRQVLDQPIVMERRRRDAKPLGAPRYRWIIDWLDRTAYRSRMLEASRQRAESPTGTGMICDCDDIIGMPALRKARRVLSTCNRWANSFRDRSLQMGDALCGGGGDRRRHCGREDEARRARTDRVADHRISCYVTTHDPEALRQCPFDDIDTVHNPIALGNAGAGTVETDGMHFIEISKRPEFRGQIADRPDRGDIAIHRVKRFRKLRPWAGCALFPAAAPRDGQDHYAARCVFRPRSREFRRSSRHGSSSERMRQFGSNRPIVPSAASLDT